MKYTTAILFSSCLAISLAACNTNKNKDESTTTPATTEISATMPGDSSVATTSPTDNTVASPATDTSATAIPNPAKKGKKGSANVTTQPKKAGANMDETDTEGYYTNVSPSFPGGDRAISNFFNRTIQYPADAEDNGVEGTVTLSFTVDENGVVSAPRTVGPRLGYGLEEEALRVFKQMPKWTPGNLKGKNVKTRFTLPVTFQLM